MKIARNRVCVAITAAFSLAGIDAWAGGVGLVLPTGQIRVSLTEFESSEDRGTRSAVGSLVR